MQADDALLTPLRDAVAAAQSAPLVPARVHNRLMTVVWRECDRLAATAEGQAALAGAAVKDPEPMVRLSAAAVVARWDADAGAAALEALVVESGGRIVRPMTMTAALAVREEPGRSAALCLLNGDRGRAAVQPPPAPPSTSPRVSVAPSWLDAAERVYALAMNCGFEHAYEVAGCDFDAAAAGLHAVGATVAADVLRRAVHLLGTSPQTADSDAELARLDEQFAAIDVMGLLEAALES